MGLGFRREPERSARKIIEECKLMYGIFNIGEFKKEWFEEFISHAGKIIAIEKNGKERKGK
jgi:hypothetical protein